MATNGIIVSNGAVQIANSNSKMILPPFKAYEWAAEWLETRNLTPRSISVYRSNLYRFFDYLKDREMLDENGLSAQAIDARVISSFVNMLKNTKKPNGNKKYEATAIQNYIATLKSFFHYLDNHKLYPNATLDLKNEKINRQRFKKKDLKIDESRKLLASIDIGSANGKRDIAMIALMLVCGLRTIEVSRANVGSIEKNGDVYILRVQSKGSAEDSDIVRIPALVLNMIRDYLATRSNCKPDDPLFVSTSNRSHGERLSTKTISVIAKRELKKAGFDSSMYTAHSLRHSAASNAIRLGVSLEEVCQMLRHKSISTTMIYNHANEELENTAELSVAEALEGFNEIKSIDSTDSTETAIDRDDSESKAQSNTSKKSKSKKHRGSSARNSIEDGGNTISVRSLISALKSEGYRLI